MKKQLATSVRIVYTNLCVEHPERVVLGEVFYTGRTRILKRLVRKVIHRVEHPIDFYTSIEEAKKEVQNKLNVYVQEYYAHSNQ